MAVLKDRLLQLIPQLREETSKLLAEYGDQPCSTAGTQTWP